MEKLAFAIYMTVLVIGVLLFGAVHTYAYTLMEIGVLGASLLVVADMVRLDGGRRVIRISQNPFLLGFFLIAAVLLIQMLPVFSSGVIAWFSPQSVVVSDWKPLVMDIGPRTGSITPYIHPVRESLIRWVVYGLFFLGMVHVLNTRKRIETAIWVVLILGCFEAVYGIFENYSGTNHIWWFNKLSYADVVTGTYVNRNHFAGLMEMGVMLSAGFTVAMVSRKRAPGGRSDRKRPVDDWKKRLAAMDQVVFKRMLILFMGIIMGVGLILSASRGGIISASLGLLTMALLLLFNKMHRRKSLVLLCLFLGILVYGLSVGMDYTVKRFEYFDSTFEDRSRLARNTLRIYDDFSKTGIGIGNLRYAFPRYQAIEDADGFVDYTHNDWAQFLAEGGVAGAVALLAGIGIYLIGFWRRWRKRNDVLAVGLGAASISAMVSLGVHSYSDFNLHIPANFLMLMAVMAIGCSAVFLEHHPQGERPAFRYWAMPIKSGGAAVLIAILGVIGWTGVWTVRHAAAEGYCNTENNSTLKSNPDPPIENIAKAIGWNPSNAQYWYKLGSALIRFRNKGYIVKTPGEADNESVEDSIKRRMDTIRKLDSPLMEPVSRCLSEQYPSEKIISCQQAVIYALEQAAMRNPFAADYHLLLGWEYTRITRFPDFMRLWLPAADAAMERAAVMTGDVSPAVQESLGNYWVMRTTTHPYKRDAWNAAWGNAMLHYRKARKITKGNDLKLLQKRAEDYVKKHHPNEAMEMENYRGFEVSGGKTISKKPNNQN